MCDTRSAKMALSQLESNIRKKLSPAEANNIVLAPSPKTVKHPRTRYSGHVTAHPARGCVPPVSIVLTGERVTLARRLEGKNAARRVRKVFRGAYLTE
jgi:hypothetical protein